jgi:hypothetical protein
MSGYDFTTDEASRQYCDLIMEHMVGTLGVPADEALQKMNRLWKGLSFLGEDDLIYHQDVDYWAEMMVYGKCRRRP